MQDAKRVIATGVAVPSGAFSHATVIAVGNARLIFVSGQVPSGPDGELVGEGDMQAQTDQVFRNLERVLQACGSALHEVVKITSFVTDAHARTAFSTVRDRVFADTRPASTFVEVSALANPRWMVEIEAVAVSHS